MRIRGHVGGEEGRTLKFRLESIPPYSTTVKGAVARHVPETPIYPSMPQYSIY
jgi:hypothetical protein